MPETLHLSASHTIELGDSDDRLLLVKKGCVELFLAWNSEVMQGRRHHFATLPEGSWIFDVGFGFRDHGITVLAVGQAETAVEVHDLTGREKAAEATGADLAVQLDRWIELVEEGIARLMASTRRKTRLLQAGETPALNGGETAGLAGGRPLWWEVDAPDALFFDAKEVDVELIPLADAAWVTCPQGTRASRLITSQEFLTRPDWLDDIARASDLLLRTIQAGIVTRGERELEARERRSQLREAAGDAAWGEIASVLAAAEASPGLPAASTLDSLIFAFETVARHRGIVPQLPHNIHHIGTTLPVYETLSRMVRKTSIRMRKVIFEGGWYKKDNGALIGFLQKGGEAVALIPQGSRGYLMRKGDGSTLTITAENFELLHPFAYTLYRSLPDRPLSLKDVLIFCLRDNKRDAWTLVAMVILTGILGMVTPALTGRIFDLIVPQAERDVMLQVGVILLTAAVVRTIFELVRGIALLRIQNRTDANLQAAVWDRILKMPTQFFRKYTAGDLATRAQGINQIHEILSSSGATVLLILPAALFNFVVMFTHSVVLSLWGLGLAVAALLISFFLNARQVMILRKQFEVQGRLAGLVFQLINGVAKFRIAGAEQLAFATWAKDYAQQERHTVQAGRWGVAAQTFFSGYGLLTSAVIFGAMAYLMGKGEGFTTGSFLAFNAAFGALVGALTMVGNSSLSLLQIFPLLERTKPIFEGEPEVEEDRAAPGPLSGGLEMANIRFRYSEDTPPILENFSLKVAPGEFVALVGPSGSGKSTILRLLLGFEMPESGAVFYDGKDLNTLELREVRRQIGVVLQSSKLIAGDIYRNIVGETSLTLDDAWKAAERAGLADDIRKMPMQMHTVISEGGAGFSGGQKQRLAIARALAHSPRLLFFDEATSALDNRTQAIVTASLEKTDATRIIIAHRLSTIMQADRIVVLRHGRVVEDGTYEELMEQKGFFHELAIRQMANPEEGETA